SAIDALAKIAAANAIWLHVGSMVVRIAEDKVANRSVLFTPNGDIAATYDKMHMFDVDLPGGETYRESSVYQAGSEPVVASTALAILGLTICYDLRFPNLFKQLAQKGADVISVPAAFTKQTGEAHWEVLLRARAIETGAYVIAPAQGGRHEDGRSTYGSSLVVDPWGTVIARAPDDAPGVVFADIDTGRVVDARRRIPAWSLDLPAQNRTS
ncbi:MAG: carbon-nitrogen hydrolase family protein, partial [Pseudomonadota bacterium]